MAINSINTNDGSFIALQNLAATNATLRATQDRISTGKKIAMPKDNGAIWAIAQNLRGASQSINAVKNSLDRAQSAVDVAMTAGTNVSDLLLQMKEKALAAADVALDTGSRRALNEDFKVLRETVRKSINNADFNGTNMLKTGGTTVRGLANVAGTDSITVAAQNLSFGAAGVARPATAINTMTIGINIGTHNSSAAAVTLAAIDATVLNVNRALAVMGAQYKALALHNTFMAKLQDNLDSGVGNLVDADLGRESARLQSLQSRQQLGVQAASIANQSTSALLGLFR
jgi:flagellin